MSFSLDVSAMMSYAAQMFNSLGPIAGLVGGLALGLGLVSFIIAKLTKISIR